MLRNKFIIRNKIITKKSKTFVISEIGINHEGSFEKCVKMIQLSKKAGADAIKLQTIDPDKSYAYDTESYRLFSMSKLNKTERPCGSSTFGRWSRWRKRS